MKKVFILILCLYGTLAYSQDCDREALKTLPGKWLPQTNATANDGAMFVPIIPSPEYSNPGLPKWAPQFIVIAVERTDGFIGQNVRKVVDDDIEFFKSLLANK